MVLGARHAASRRAFGAGLIAVVIGLATPAFAAPRFSSEDAAEAVERQTLERARQAQYVVREAPIDALRIDTPKLPDLTPYSADAVRAKIKPSSGKAAVRRMVELEALGEYVGGQERLREWAQRQTQNPLAIVVERGTMTLKQLAAAVPPNQLVETEPGIFTLRLPLLVAQHASLVIDESVKELRLSEERGAFIVNDGSLFVLDTRVVGWREADKAPSQFRKPEAFRPFLISWGGAKMYLVNSYFGNLGYDASKSYGVQYSQYSPNRQARLKRPPAGGWVIGSTFVDHWYGFYCFEADDVAVIGNTYRDNIVYGIDPHDRSRRLVIANNLVHGTRKKHGIIISREVDDSWIFGNRSWNNGLSGIVIDRNSIRNVIAHNVVYDNRGDGITIYESPDNLLWENRSIGNAKHGIRIRNSMRIRLQNNDATANGLTGIYGHVKDLAGTDRDLRLDPFQQNVSMVIVGGSLVHNLSGPMSIDRPISVELYDVALLAPPRRSGIRLTGVLGEHQDRVLDLLVRQRVPVVIEPSGGAGRKGT